MMYVKSLYRLYWSQFLWFKKKHADYEISESPLFESVLSRYVQKQRNKLYSHGRTPLFLLSKNHFTTITTFIEIDWWVEYIVWVVKSHIIKIMRAQNVPRLGIYWVGTYVSKKKPIESHCNFLFLMYITYSLTHFITITTVIGIYFWV